MNEEYVLGVKVRHCLEASSRQLDRDIVDRLACGRQQALAKQKGLRSTKLNLAIAGLGNFTSDSFMQGTRTALTLLALAMGMTGTYYWNTFQDVEEAVEIDTALLSGDLPVAAYTDQGFDSWIEHSSQP